MGKEECEMILNMAIDVTNMVTSMVTTNANYGFLVRLVNETAFNSRIYVSIYNTNYPTKHPKLVVTYKKQKVLS